ncbi:hypothetical protein B0H17DRAFT_1096011 [Mycena rosella]|uniref:DUF6699 domain-containing protein n=1 Tax=Mycena rosella TaxID=1033263 RepID=A0AAD7CRD0_MYCRO|nr:hypothetical protein B0H17DRAFT_1096011 [Mycena rosella]
MRRLYVPPAPGLHWGLLPLPCVPLHAPEHRKTDPLPCLGVPRLARVPDAQPRRPLRPIALPPQIPGVTSVALHPALASPRTRLSADVDFASIRVPTPDPERTASAWHQPATYPALPSLAIISPHLPWAITAHGQAAGVTVADVLHAIWEALRLCVDQAQFEDDWELHGGMLVMYRCGMTRLDLLGGKTRFAGLGESTMGCDVWVLDLA